MTERYTIAATLDRVRRFNRWYEPADLGADAGSARALAGVNVAGYLRDESGWGAAGRGYVRALRALGIPVALRDLSPLTSNRSEDPTHTAFDDDHPFDVNLVCVDAGQHFALLTHAGEQLFEGRYNVGAWAWELPRFPERWYDRFAYYDEIWVTTSFIANALAPISPVPVVRIPPVLTPLSIGSRELGRQRLGVPPDQLVYLFVFDFHSHLQRKNPLALIEAFRAAFSPADRARLVIKCVNGASDPAGFAKLRARAEAHRIDVYDGYWPAADLRDLMAACDVYTSLHRSEGTGLTITDAMALGKPVIATGWSGNLDFMDVSNSLPVRYHLVEIEESVGPYRAGEIWAEPSVEHAAELMRLVFEQRDRGPALGSAAKRHIETHYSEKAIAGLIEQRLAVVGSRHQFASFRNEIRTFQQCYAHLVREIRSVVRDVVPAGATVLVVSKGDEELVELPGTKAWHFPRTDSGLYAGYHPSDSDAAIAHLEELRRAGGRFLLFPGTALWWLDHYSGLREHLEARYPRLWNDETCVIFDLTGTTGDLSHSASGHQPSAPEYHATGRRS